jgi:hypothetical protein
MTQAALLSGVGTNATTGGTVALTSGTAQASTSGTSIDFTGIPSWVKRITVMFNGVVNTGASNLIIQIGAGSVTTSGYASNASTVGSGGNNSSTSTAGFVVDGTPTGSWVRRGIATICLMGSNTWACSSTLGALSTLNNFGGGNVTLSGALDRVRITGSNGTDTFSAGSINILYE